MVGTVRPLRAPVLTDATEEQDIAFEHGALADKKSWPSAVLIDLGRNDVGRVAETGSVKVTEK